MRTREPLTLDLDWMNSVSMKCTGICNRAWAYSRADFEPSFLVELKTSQWRETCALAGSMAEALMLSAATYIEAVWHSRAIAAGTEPAGMAIAQRYLADAAIETAASVGHRLINLSPVCCRGMGWVRTGGHPRCCVRSVGSR